MAPKRVYDEETVKNVASLFFDPSISWSKDQMVSILDMKLVDVNAYVKHVEFDCVRNQFTDLQDRLALFTKKFLDTPEVEPPKPPRTYENNAVEIQLAMRERQDADERERERIEEEDRIRNEEEASLQRVVSERVWAERHKKNDLARYNEAARVDAIARHQRYITVSHQINFENTHVARVVAVWNQLQPHEQEHENARSLAFHAAFMTRMETDQVIAWRHNSAAWTERWDRYIADIMAQGHGLVCPISQLIFPACDVSTYSSEQLQMVHAVASRHGF